MSSIREGIKPLWDQAAQTPAVRVRTPHQPTLALSVSFRLRHGAQRRRMAAGAECLGEGGSRHPDPRTRDPHQVKGRDSIFPVTDFPKIRGVCLQGGAHSPPRHPRPGVDQLTVLGEFVNIPTWLSFAFKWQGLESGKERGAFSHLCQQLGEA